MARNKFKCLDCKTDTGKIGEYYMLIDSVWRSVVDSDDGMLCVGCIEKRLGRRLCLSDFNDSFVNRPGAGTKSGRLLDRLTNL